MAAIRRSSRSCEDVGVTLAHRRIALVLALAAIGVSACSPGSDTTHAAPVAETAGRLVLSIETADTAPDGRRCILDVTARNHTGHAALNVQAAWMARTDGFGSISDYQVLGDFAAGEARSLQLGIFGAPCDAVRDVTLSRAVCTVGAVEGSPQSCADLVMLDDSGLTTRR